MHVLQRDENGLEKCVACFLCAAACPSNCIYIEAADNTAENRISGAERYAKVYNIDYNRCIFCGYCVEACPTDAITHGHGFEVAALNASSLVYRKEQMLAPRPALQGQNAIFSTSDEAQLQAERERGGVGTMNREIWPAGDRVICLSDDPMTRSPDHRLFKRNVSFSPNRAGARRHLRRRHGHQHPGAPALAGRLLGQRRLQRNAGPEPPGHHPRHSCQLLRRRLRRGRDRYLRRHAASCSASTICKTRSRRSTARR